MANRYFDQFNQTLDKGVVTLFAVVNFGASGAPTLQKWDPSARSYSTANSSGFRGIKSIVRTSAGTYDITFQDSYNRLLQFSYTFQNSSAAAAPLVIVQTPNTNLTSTSAPKLSMTFENTSGTATDPASGEQVIFAFTLQNSTAF